MQITIAHYHLNPGGVTRIIESQVKSLLMIDPEIKLKVICGGWSEKSFSLPAEVELIVYPELNYLENKSYQTNELEKPYETVLSTLSKEAAQCDVLHFHNATLGKNPLISIALFHLAKDGVKIINHAHDFAEDRPANLAFMKAVIENKFGMNATEVMYPKYGNYFFGVINSSDERRVLGYNYSRSQLNKWLNPVSIPLIPKGASKMKSRDRLIQGLNLDETKLIISYPVRVIRRKNIGEFLLLAWYFEDKASCLVTQPPNNPVEKTFYDKWVRFAKDENIDVTFEAGQKADFVDVMMGSDLCITTSIMEGFGMVFVEPWFWGTPVKGRAIPAVMDDLTGSGIDFPFLYNGINVESNEGSVDFASLDYDAQKVQIKKCISKGKEAFHKLNPELDQLMVNVDPKIIEANKNALTRSLSEKNYGRVLFELYKTIS